MATLSLTTTATTVSPGVTNTYTATLVGGAANTTYSVAFLSSSPVFNNGLPFVSITADITTNSSGGGTYSVSSQDTGSTPRGVFSTWASIASLGITTSTINITYVDASGTLAPTSAPTSSPTPTPTWVPTPAPSTGDSGITVRLYSDRAIAGVGDTTQWMISLANAISNKTYTVDILTTFSGLNNGVETLTSTVSVLTLTSGAGSTTWVSVDTNVAPRGIYSHRARVRNSSNENIYSNTISYTLQSGSGPNPTGLPTPAPTAAPTPSPENPGTGARFVATGQVSADLRATLQGEGSNATVLSGLLARTQSCDYDSDLVNSIQSTAVDSLGTYIRDHLRNNAGDETALKPIRRYYFNPGTLEKGYSQKAYAASNTTQQDLTLGVLEDTITYYSTKTPSYSVVNGKRLQFTASGKYLVYFDINVGLWSGQGALASQALTPVWRYGSMVNHEVSFSIYAIVRGNLASAAESYAIPILSSYVLQQDVLDKYAQRLNGSFAFDAIDSSFGLGSITSIEFVVIRGSWVATYDGTQERLGFFKLTDAGVTDSSNYIEIIQLS